ncbi:MAG: ATP-dependent DNA helicase RecG [Candidatus Margulisbacteria bacterium]|nr:ATP-dependent DNA helicase RecG [Candidatus Margulisiibacteriota bacterium]
MDIQFIKGVGPAVAAKLKKLNLADTRDVLTFFPAAYQDRRYIKPVFKLVPGQDEFATGKLRSIREIRKGKYLLLQAFLYDETGEIKCIWFNQPFLKKILKTEIPIFIHGKIEYDFVNRIKTIKVTEYEYVDETNINRVVPVYPLTSGIYQKQLRAIVGRALKMELPQVADPFPQELLDKYNLVSLREAIGQYHYPRDEKAYLSSKRRLIFEDFIYLQLSLAISRSLISIREKGIAFKFKNTISREYFDSIPYRLTRAQIRVIDDVRKDMQSDKPMNRLVQGDVGAGKTEVAMAAILVALENDYQVAIMAPTEILAHQHYQKMLKYLLPLGINVELLVGSLKESSKIRKHYLIAAGNAQVIVGTHAVIQEKVKYSNLGLAIIDEQHRFGVLQRSALMKKSGETIDLLVLTATPIPRTLTLTLYGDLDKSILDEMPPGRTPIKTVWLKKLNKETLDFIKEEIKKGNQVYWVFPLVEESEKIDLKAATEGKEHIAKNLLPKHRIGLLHGKMKQKEKDSIMEKFRNRELDVLVSTTVIEVGVDVPDATVMVIEHAERFGLSQLHQLRGRIGRSNKPSVCFLLSQTRTEPGKARLGAMVQSTDGFYLAEIDLQLRGPGDYFGSKQSGLPTMYVANLIKDEKILLETKQMAAEIAEDYKNSKYKQVISTLKSKPHLFVGSQGMN